MTKDKTLKWVAKTADKVARASVGRCLVHYYQPKVPTQLKLEQKDK